MKEITLDTSVVFDIESSEVDEEVIESTRGKKLCITSPTLSELWYGMLDKDEETQQKEWKRLGKYKILNTTRDSSRIFSELTYELEKKGKMVPTFDILIASIAMDRGTKLLTRDKHFSRIEGLDVQML